MKHRRIISISLSLHFYKEANSFLTTPCMRVASLGLTELTTLCCSRFLQTVWFRDKHLETGLFSLLSSSFKETEVLVLTSVWGGKERILLYIILRNFSIIHRIKTKFWTWFFRFFNQFLSVCLSVFLSFFFLSFSFFLLFQSYPQNYKFSLFLPHGIRFLFKVIPLSLVVFTIIFAIFPRISSWFSPIGH